MPKDTIAYVNHKNHKNYVCHTGALDTSARSWKGHNVTWSQFLIVWRPFQRTHTCTCTTTHAHTCIHREAKASFSVYPTYCFWLEQDPQITKYLYFCYVRVVWGKRRALHTCGKLLKFYYLKQQKQIFFFLNTLKSANYLSHRNLFVTTIMDKIFEKNSSFLVK